MKKLSFLNTYLLELAFFALLIRVLIVGADIGLALAIVSVVISISYAKFINKSKIEDRQELEAKLDSALEQINKRVDEVNNKIGTVALNNNVKRTTNESQALAVKPVGATPKRYF